MSRKTLKDISIIISFVLITTFLIWLPHILSISNFWGLNFSNGFNTIYRNFDGLEYIIIAKTFYRPELIAGIPQNMQPMYFASHFPGFPMAIWIFSPLFGFLKSMLLVTLLFTMASGVAFYFFVKDFKLSSKPLLLSLIFLLLPARWVIVHSVGSSEPMFIFFIIMSLYYLMKYVQSGSRSVNAIWLSAIFAADAQLVRPPGILLAISIGLFVLWQAWKRKSIKYILNFYPFLLVPLVLSGVFLLYQQSYGDFFAYFHSGDNIHLTFPPFQIFNYHQSWVGTIWLEDIIYIFLFGILGGLTLIKQKLYPLAFFVFTYLFFSSFVAHLDLSRYTLPIVPFVLIAFEKVLVSKEFKIVLIILALAIYLYSQNFIIANFAPIADLSIYN